METAYKEVSGDTVLEISYKYYSEESTYDYDTPSDPEEFEITSIFLVNGEGKKIDVTYLTEDLCQAMAWDKILEFISNQHN